MISIKNFLFIALSLAPILSFAQNFGLDVDGDGVVNPFTDAVLVTRYFLGTRNESLVVQAVGDACTRCTVASITAYLDFRIARGDLDVDGDGIMNFDTDAELIKRFLLGLRDSSLLQQAVSPSCSRCNPGSIESYLHSLIPPGGISPSFSLPDPEVSEEPLAVMVDLEGDKDLDLLCFDGSLFYFENSGSLVNPFWEPPVDILVESPRQPFGAGDVDNDGDADVLVGITAGLLFVKNLAAEDGSLVFSDPRSDIFGVETLSESADFVYFEDIDSDNDLDLLAYTRKISLIDTFVPNTLDVGLVENVGNSSSPIWRDISSRLSDVRKIDVLRLNVTVGDVDSDDDMDIFAGVSGNQRPSFQRNVEEHLLLFPRYLTITSGDTHQIQANRDKSELNFIFIQNRSGGSIDQNGLYTAGTDHVGVDILKVETKGNVEISGLMVVNVISNEDSDRSGKALIVVGKRWENDNLFPTSERLAMDAYVVCRQRGYSPSNIRLLTPDGTLTRSNHLGYSIEVFGNNHLLDDVFMNDSWTEEADDLLIYFVDHGVVKDGIGHLVLQPSVSESALLSGTQLRAWLDRWQTDGKKVATIIDTCYSGHFIQALQGTPNLPTPNRIVISSSGPNQLAHFQAGGRVSFSQYFWDELAAGETLGVAFDRTQDSIAILSQVPTFDFNGDGLVDESPRDNLTHKIGLPELFHGVQRPIIRTSFENVVAIDNAATLWAGDVISNNGIRKVSAYIMPPGLETNVADGVALTTLPKVDLVDYVASKAIKTSDFNRLLSSSFELIGNPEKQLLATRYFDNGKGFYELIPGSSATQLKLLRNVLDRFKLFRRFEVDWPHFETPGIYRVLLVAEDNWGMFSPTKTAFVTVEGAAHKAVVVECRGNAGIPEPWNGADIGKQAHLMFSSLLRRSYTEDNILWFGTDMAPADKQAIEATLKSNCGSSAIGAQAPEQLVLYLVGNATSEGVRIANNELITPPELKGWLDCFQEKYTETAVIIIVETDFAGIFISGLANNAYDRYIIASTDDNTPTLRVGGMTFGRWFWGEILRQNSVWHAFANAKTFARASGFESPIFQMDDDGNGIYENKKDGTITRNTFMGTLFLTGNIDIVIGRVGRTVYVEESGTASLWAADLIVPDSDLPIGVWATVIHPNAGSTSAQTIERVNMAFHPVTGRYEAQYSGFTVPGRYIAVIHAESINNPEKAALPVPIEIYYGAPPPTAPIDRPDENHERLIPNAGPKEYTLLSSTSDTFHLFAGIGQRLNIDLSEISATADLVLSIRIPGIVGPNGVLIGVDDWGIGLDERIWSWEPPTTGWYVIEVSGLGAARSNITYRLSVTLEQDIGNDIYEPDDNPPQASFISLEDGAFQEHNFHDEGDNDWIQFFAIEGVSYTVEVFEADAANDTVLELYGEDGITRIGEPIDDFIEGEGEMLSFDPGQLADSDPNGDDSGIFYVRIFSFNPAIFGVGTSYRLRALHTTGFIPGFLAGVFKTVSGVPLAGSLEVVGIGNFAVPSNGSYTLMLPLDTYQVTGTASGFRSISTTVSVIAGEITQQDFILEPLFTTNHRPTLDTISDPAAILEDAGAQTINLTGIGAGAGENQELTVTASSANTDLIPNPTVTYISPNATGSLGYTPVANASGTAVITVTVTDDATAGGAALSIARTFTVAVTAINDGPLFTSVPDTSAPELLPYTYFITTADPEEDAVASIAIGPQRSLPAWLNLTDHHDGTATLSGTPTAHEIGSYPIALVATDEHGASSSQQFTIMVTERPSFDVDGDGVADGSTDGILILRYLFGFRGDALAVGVVNEADCYRCDAEDIESILAQAEAAGTLDADDNNEFDALTDGIIILRWLHGVTGDPLISGAVAQDCQRCGVSTIETVLTGFTP